MARRGVDLHRTDLERERSDHWLLPSLECGSRVLRWQAIARVSRSAGVVCEIGDASGADGVVYGQLGRGVVRDVWEGWRVGASTSAVVQKQTDADIRRHVVRVPTAIMDGVAGKQ